MRAATRCGAGRTERGGGGRTSPSKSRAEKKSWREAPPRPYPSRLQYWVALAMIRLQPASYRAKGLRCPYDVPRSCASRVMPRARICGGKSRRGDARVARFLGWWALRTRNPGHSNLPVPVPGISIVPRPVQSRVPVPGYWVPVLCYRYKYQYGIWYRANPDDANGKGQGLRITGTRTVHLTVPGTGYWYG